MKLNILNKKKVILLISIAGAFLVASLLITLFVKLGGLKKQLRQSNLMFKQMQAETQRLEEEKSKVEAEKEQLQEDTFSYLGINASLEADKKTLELALDEAKTTLESKVGDLQRAKLKLERLEEKMSKEDTALKSKLEKESRELKEQIQSLEETLQTERGLYQYNLAVAYTQSEIYDRAIKAYEKSLKIDPDNPEAHYNLGLLYLNFDNYPEKAVEHFYSYLELRPDAEDVEEVEVWIKELSK